MAGRYISIKSGEGQEFKGYLAVPRSGKGPGIVLCQEIFGINPYMRRMADLYAEEGYVVLAPDLFWRQEPGVELGYTPGEWQRAFALMQAFDLDKGIKDIGAALATLRAQPEFAGQAGVLGFCLGGKLAMLAACRLDGVSVAVGYYGVALENHLQELSNLKGRLVMHFAADDHYCQPPARDRIIEAIRQRPNTACYLYPGVDHAFARIGETPYNKTAADLAHQRSLGALRREIGPYFDFSALWEAHCAYEFGSREVGPLMKTMVDAPYVNHIPTMTGGVGHAQLKRFYQHHFVNSNPPDTQLIPVSRTIGANQLVDELLFRFTHTHEIDWMLPGVAPTGRRVEIPLVAIVKFRGDKLCHEHIYWDQASVLVQIGVLDPTGLPVAGIETAKKLLDENLPSNTLMPNWRNSEGKG